jgi:hypothetical protein
MAGHPDLSAQSTYRFGSMFALGRLQVATKTTEVGYGEKACEMKGTAY